MTTINTNWSVPVAQSSGLAAFDKTGDAGKPDGVISQKDIDMLSKEEIKAAQVAVEKDTMLTKPQKETISRALSYAEITRDMKINLNHSLIEDMNRRKISEIEEQIKKLPYQMIKE